MRKHIAFLAAALLVANAASAWGGIDPPGFAKGAQQQQDKPLKLPPNVDLVIALDVSNSMDGLIDQARAKLWDVVAIMAAAKPQPKLRIGLISYGNDRYPAAGGWVRKEADLTSDLDGVYAKLIGLTTYGGTEYVTRAVHDAIHDMQWTQGDQTLRLIFVAGNEPANQDPTLSLADVAKDAESHKIRVHTIYCGPESNPEKVAWAGFAKAAHGGSYAIDQNQVATVATPVDDQLAALSTKLNSTYIAYGAGGKAKAANQVAQDANAARLGSSVAAGRAGAKSSAVYHNEEWDLVDRHAQGGAAAVAAVPAEALPPPLAALPPAEREKVVAEKAKERAQIQQQIAELSKKRDAYIKSERAKAPRKAKALDDAMMDALQ